MKSLALVLMIAGIAGLIYGGFGYGRHRTSIDMGSMSASVTEHGAFPIAALIGGLALAGGLVLYLNERRRA